MNKIKTMVIMNIFILSACYNVMANSEQAFKDQVSLHQNRVAFIIGKALKVESNIKKFVEAKVSTAKTSNAPADWTAAISRLKSQVGKLMPEMTSSQGGATLQAGAKWIEENPPATT